METTINQAQVWLETLLALMGFPAKVSVIDPPDNTLVMGIWLAIDETGLSPAQREALLADEGAPLDSIQYLLNSTLHQKVGANPETTTTFTLELGDFRQKRQAELISLSQAAAQRVRDTHQPVEMEALSSADRRQVHSFFQDSEDLETESQGLEPHRRLVIRPRR